MRNYRLSKPFRSTFLLNHSADKQDGRIFLPALRRSKLDLRPAGRRDRGHGLRSLDRPRAVEIRPDPTHGSRPACGCRSGGLGHRPGTGVGNRHAAGRRTGLPGLPDPPTDGRRFQVSTSGHLLVALVPGLIVALRDTPRPLDRRNHSWHVLRARPVRPAQALGRRAGSRNHKCPDRGPRSGVGEVVIVDLRSFRTSNNSPARQVRSPRLSVARRPFAVK